jgi:hypothetical protein
MPHPSCESPFWKDPAGFLRNFSFSYNPSCPEAIWNLFVRLGLIGLVVGLLGVPVCGATSMSVAILFAAVVAFVIVYSTPTPAPQSKRDSLLNTMSDVQLTPMFSAEQFADKASAVGGAKLQKGMAKPGAKPAVEGFVAASPPIISRVVGIEANLPFEEAAPYSGPALPEYTPPSARNLFMNVLIDEYKYNPDRPAAAPVTDPLVKQTLDDYFRVQWFSDPTDVFGKNQSQRQFVTQPSTSVPNDRESYQNWLYKIPGKTCKEGGQYCTTRGSAGGPVVWLGE